MSLPTIGSAEAKSFYAQRVKANVLFFDRKPAADKQAGKTKLWIYDLRTTHMVGASGSENSATGIGT